MYIFRIKRQTPLLLCFYSYYFIISIIIGNVSEASDEPLLRVIVDYSCRMPHVLTHHTLFWQGHRSSQTITQTEGSTRNLLRMAELTEWVTIGRVNSGQRWKVVESLSCRRLGIAPRSKGSPII